MKFFEYSHLPEKLQAISKMFHDLASDICYNLPANEESYHALRKLLEAKDCAVRSVLIAESCDKSGAKFCGTCKKNPPNAICNRLLTCVKPNYKDWAPKEDQQKSKCCTTCLKTLPGNTCGSNRCGFHNDYIDHIPRDGQ